MERPSSPATGKWRDAQVAERYANARFSSRRARERDLALVTQLLARLDPPVASVLDAPCGTGRLFQALAGDGRRVFGVDASFEMLRQSRASGAHAVACVGGDALALPFRANAFDAVVCCRLAHHLHSGAELDRLFAELARVARRAVIVSFWDAASWPAWRTRVGWKRSEGARGRLARPRRELVARLAAAGLEAREFRASFRFVSQQTFVLACKR
ncbi:MAG: class I SAM-dependent methyltransferase [Planctomycetes bacterium]|nr:class I SAM-dependent methyltransferase [Planctomycetota bacterium]